MNEPKWHPNSGPMPVLWRVISENPGCAVCDLLRWTGYPRQNIDKSLRRMIRNGLIHISGYQRYESTRSGMARQFTVGPGENLPRPRVPKPHQVRAHRDNARARSRRIIIGKASKEGGALAAMVAQLRLTT